MRGHLLGAAGGVEGVLSVKSIQDNILPPTINYETPDEGIDLDYVPNQSREEEVNTVLSNSFVFGGDIASLVIRQLTYNIIYTVSVSYFFYFYFMYPFLLYLQ